MTRSIKNLEQLLQKCLKDETLVLKQYDIKKLIPDGENYGSFMLKLTVKIYRNNQLEVLHVAAKVPRPADKLTNWSNALKKEVFVYEFLLPNYRKLERESSLSETDFSPKYLGHRYSLSEVGENVDEDSILLMENLKARNFYSCDRTKGLDKNHAEITVSALAKYHALGIALKMKKPDLFEIVENKANFFVDMSQICQSLEGLINVIEEDSSFYDVLPKVKPLFTKVMSSFKAIETPLKPVTAWATINHGDFSIFNVMYRFDENGKIEVKFVDFPGFMHSHALQDLSYFLFSSVNLSDEDCTNQLMLYYLTSFKNKLIELGLKDAVDEFYDETAFMSEMKEQCGFMLPFIILGLKLYCAEKEEVSGDNLVAMDVLLVKKGYKFNDAAKKRMLRVINLFIEKEWI